MQECDESLANLSARKKEVSHAGDGARAGGNADPQDPRLWTQWRKLSIFAIVFCATLVTSYSSGAYSPGISAMQKDHPVSYEVAQLGTSLFMFGVALGSLIWGPLSQTIGRRPVMLASSLGLTLFNLGACLSETVAGILLCRLFAGIWSSATFSNIAGILIDITTPRQRNPFNAWFRFAAFAGPPLAALLGSVAVEDSSWRWNLRSLPIAAFVVLAVSAVALPETCAPVIERSRHILSEERDRVAAQNRGSVDESSIARKTRAALPSRSVLTALITDFKKQLYIPWMLLFEEPIVMVVCFYTSLLYGLLYGTLLFFPYVWSTKRGFTPVQVGYTYFAVLAGFMTSTALLGSWIQHSAYKRAYDSTSQPAPEVRIRSGVWAITAVPVGLFIFAWTGPFTNVHWIAPVLGMLIFSFGMLHTFSSWLTYLTDTYVDNAASVIAINTFSRSIVAGAFPLFTRQMLQGMRFQGAMSMFAGISLPLTVLGILSCVYGVRLRDRSKYARHG